MKKILEADRRIVAIDSNEKIRSEKEIVGKIMALIDRALKDMDKKEKICFQDK